MTHVYLHGKIIAGNETKLADELSSDDSEFLACAVFADKKYTGILEAVLAKKTISKISVAAYLNPFLQSAIKQQWLEAIRAQDKKLAETVALLSAKMPRLVSQAATQHDIESFHVAASAIMHYLTKESSSPLQKSAITMPGWAGILRLSREESNEKSPWSLGWWLAEKGYKL